jgi:hypothetical protein
MQHVEGVEHPIVEKDMEPETNTLVGSICSTKGNADPQANY